MMYKLWFQRGGMPAVPLFIFMRIAGKYHGEVFVVYPDPDKTRGYRIEDREGNKIDKTEFTLSTPNRNELESILGCARDTAENFEMLADSMLEPFWFDYEYYN